MVSTGKVCGSYLMVIGDASMVDTEVVMMIDGCDGREGREGRALLACTDHTHTDRPHDGDTTTDHIMQQQRTVHEPHARHKSLASY
jgi:hypothetical protein